MYKILAACLLALLQMSLKDDNLLQLGRRNTIYSLSIATLTPFSPVAHPVMNAMGDCLIKFKFLAFEKLTANCSGSFVYFGLCAVPA